MRVLVALVLLLAGPAAHAELTCAQLGEIALKTVDQRNQGASLTRLIADVERGELKGRLTEREIALVKDVVRVSFDGRLSPAEVVESCQQGAVIVPAR
jgi:hypothetical protein